MKDYSELIDKVCDDELSDDERRQVERLLREDKTFVAELQAHRDILGYLEYLGKKEELNKYHEEFLNDECQSRIKPLLRKRWLAAASVILFLSVSALAFIRIYLPEGKKPVAERNEIPVPVPLNADLKIQRYTIDGSQNIRLTGEEGIELYFPAGCLINDRRNTHTGMIQVHLFETGDPEIIASLVDTVNSAVPSKLFYFQAKADNNLRIDPVNPPVISNAGLKLMKGTLSGQRITLQNPPEIKILLTEITPEMEAYQRYLDSKLLVDSVAIHYVLKGEQYILKGEKGMTISRQFMKEVKRYIAGYESGRNLNAKINKAIHSWEIYKKQREIMINPADDYVTGQYIPEFGWYGIM